MAIAPNIEDEHAPVLTVTEARQGLRGRHIAWVLGISMTLVIIALGLIWMAHAPALARTDQQASLRAAGVNVAQTVPRTQPRSSTASSATAGIGADGKGL
jgi:hypothetical protein